MRMHMLLSCRDIWAIWGLRFVPDQTPEIMSVGQVLAKGYASCTGLSIFLVNACRAVGIPARIAGELQAHYDCQQSAVLCKSGVMRKPAATRNLSTQSHTQLIQYAMLR